ncbi:MAG: crossover junction endodeoxyribonuclease RuvC [Bacteroidetes bacterium]|nr:crossover junction endodeoxyribonuclease RuvC [Bacteroidota bacterium]
MKILGIDPGYERVGIAVLEKNKGDRKETLLYSNCFKTSAKLSLDERIFLIGKEIENVIKKWEPEALAIEKLYFENNAKTAMGVAEARGTIIFVSKSAGLEILEYTPLQIKNAVTGYGKATKDQVHSMVSKLITLPKTVKQDDEIDAIAIAITGFASYR